jgi:hypothetical protein
VQRAQIYRSKQPRITSKKRCSNEGFSRKTERLKLQVLLELNFNWLLIDQCFLVTPCLVTSVLFGLDCCVKNHVIIDFPRIIFIFNSDETDKSIEMSSVCANDKVNVATCNREVQH